MNILTKSKLTLVQALLEEAYDEKNASKFSMFFSEDGQWTINANDPVVGRSAIEELALNLMALVSSSTHNVLNAFCDDNSTCAEGTVTYTKHDGNEVTCHWCDVFTFDEEGKIKKANSYLDTSSLLA